MSYQKGTAAPDTTLAKEVVDSHGERAERAVAPADTEAGPAIASVFKEGASAIQAARYAARRLAARLP